MKSQKGNALFLILIAVALFAALSYAITQSSRGGGGIEREQAQLIAGKIVNYGISLQTATQRLLLTGCAPDELSFANDVYTTHGGTILYPEDHNPKAPADGRCDFFKANGAGMIPVTMNPAEQVQWDIQDANTAYGTISIRRVPVPGIGTDNEDLVASFPYTPENVCRNINAQLGINELGDPMPSWTINGIGLYNGFTDTLAPAVDDTGEITGQHAFCVTQTADPAPHNTAYYVVLIAR